MATTSSRQQTPDIMGAVLGGERQTGLQRLSLAAVRRDGGTQPRAGVSETHVEELVADLREGAVLPPVDVTYDGTDYWLWDGFHRVEAWRRVGRADVDARVHQGSQADAQWASYAANKAHGLRRTNADKTRAVQAALKHPNGAARSNREIGRYLGVDEGTVRYWREKLESGAEIPQVAQRTGADGKVYDTTGIGAAQQQKQAATASLAELQALISEWVAERWPGAWPENPSHTNGAFWQELTKHLRGNGVTWRDGELKMVIKQMAALRAVKQAPPTAAQRQATANECYAAAWAAVKAETPTTSVQVRLQAAIRMTVNGIRGQLPRGVVADDVALAGARLAVERELRNQADHEARKDARRAATLTPTYEQVEQAFAEWRAFVQLTPEGLEELRVRWTAAPLWTQMLAAVMSKCKTVVGVKEEWLRQVIEAAAASVAQPGQARQSEPAEPTTGDDSASSSTDERTAELHRLKLTFMHCTDALALWAEMTGRHSEVIEAKRGLRKVIDRTSDLIDGQAGMDGEQEEVLG